jgi:hypothetical protein
MFIEPSFLSIAIAKIRGGKINNIANVNFKGYFLFIAAFLMQGFLGLLNNSDILTIKKFVSNYSYYVITLSYIMMIGASLMNVKKIYMKLF